MICKQDFMNPSNEFRAKPFWAWNGDLQEAELKRQVDVMKEMGFGGYFMHSRVGLVTEYLGEEWFQLTNACADYGASQGMENWLYDEDRWPSGSAGGIVTQDRSLRMKHIRMNVGKIRETAQIVGIFSCRLEQENVYDVQKISHAGEAEKDILWFEIIENPDDPGYNGAAYLDTLNPKAVEAFLDSTHNKYLEKCGSRVGSTIKGVFTDEPHRGELLIEIDKEGLDVSSCIPYTDSLFEDFKKDWGYELQDQLPAIFLRQNGEKVSQVKWHYCETLQRLFIKNYMHQIHEWCQSHNMIFTGHLLHEDSLSAQTLMNGSLMRCYEYMDYPGVDLLGGNNVNYNIVKQVASVANQCGKKWILSEMYAATGWQTTLEDYKRIGDWQAILGINLRCPHLSWYTMAGEGKRDYPASIFFQSAWYREYKYLEDYYARLAVFMSKGTPVREVLVINPVESMWCTYYKGWAAWLNTTDEDCLKMEQDYLNMANDLLRNNIEFDYGDEEMLSRLARVEGDTLVVGQARYRYVLIPDMLTIRSSTLQLLEAFEAAGGSVAVYNKLPEYVDAKRTEVKIGNANMDMIMENRRLTVQNGNILTALRRSEDGTYYVMLLNTDAKNSAVGKLTAPSGSMQLWNPENGHVDSIERMDRISLHPGEMKLLTVSQIPKEAAAPKNLPRIHLADGFCYKTDELNVLPINQAVCCVNDKTYSGEVLKINRQVRGDAGIPMSGGMQPWCLIKAGLKEYFDYTLEYEFYSEIECSAYLAAESTGIIKVNGQEVLTSEDWWVDPCFRKSEMKVQKGRNTITIYDSYTELHSLETIYVLGEFGVYEGRIGKKPDVIDFGDITKQGFPHYSGKFTYVFQQTVSEKSALVLADLCGAAAIRVNQKMLAWKPYEIEVEPCETLEIELVLTRMNTFGQTDGSAAVLPCGLTKLIS